MSARRAVALAAVWMGVVLIGSTLVWVVISRVGGEMSRHPVAADPVGRETAAGATSPPRSRPPTTDPANGVISDTWSGIPGTMRVSCRGTTVTDWSASPDVGWYLETEREDRGVQADFEQEGEGREIKVDAVCTPTGPTFQASSDES